MLFASINYIHWGSKNTMGNKVAYLRLHIKSMFTKTYYLSVLTVLIGASTQFYSYGVVNQGRGYDQMGQSNVFGTWLST